MAARTHLPGLNPAVLTWARQRAGYDVAQVAKRFKKAPEEIRAWEAGTASPTYVQLERLAYEVYKRPVALFFFPEPPQETDPEHAFRTLPEFEIANLAPDTRLKVRDGQAKQLALRAFSGGRNPASRLIFRDLRVDARAEAQAVASKVRDFLAVDLELQRSWRTVREALGEWRERVEACGVFVFKASFRQREVSGFCLYDDELPLVYLNNSVAKSRQIFTLFHELGHVLLATNGITKRDGSYVAALRGEAYAVEVFCNAFAGHLLAPEQAIAGLIGRKAPTDEAVGEVARSLKASREVVLRRLLDLGVVSKRFYRVKAAAWTSEYFDRPPHKPGGDYYNTQGAYLSHGFLSLGFQQLYRGEISRAELADSFGVKASSIDGLEQRYLARSNT